MSALTKATVASIAAIALLVLTVNFVLKFSDVQFVSICNHSAEYKETEIFLAGARIQEPVLMIGVDSKFCVEKIILTRGGHHYKFRYEDNDYETGYLSGVSELDRTVANLYDEGQMSFEFVNADISPGDLTASLSFWVQGGTTLPLED